MEIQLIQLYVLVCHIYDPRSDTCFQRLSNNSKPVFTDQELATIYLFGHLQGLFEKKAMHKLIDNYWRHFFPHLPAYQTFNARLNLLEQTFQTVGGYVNELLTQERRPEIDHLIDSWPVMLAKGGHAFAATVARDVSDVGSRWLARLLLRLSINCALALWFPIATESAPSSSMRRDRMTKRPLRLFGILSLLPIPVNFSVMPVSILWVSI